MTAPSRRAGTSTVASLQTLKKEPANYGYINARLRARAKDLLSPEIYPSLLEMDLPEIEKWLLATPYGPVYTSDSLFSSASLSFRLQRAITALTAERCDDLRGWSRGEARLLTMILSVQTDLENGQLYLRALHTRHAGYTPSMPGCSALNSDFWAALADAKDDRTAIADLCVANAPYADILRAAIDELDRTDDVHGAEWNYIKNTFDAARAVLPCMKGARKVSERHLSLLTDLWNIRLWIGRTLMPDGAVAPRYLSGGTIPDEGFYFTGDWKALLHGTFWQRAGAGSSTPYLPALERAFLGWQIGLRRIDPLGPYVMISYMARLLSEWRSLITIVVGAEHHLDPSLLLRALMTAR